MQRTIEACIESMGKYFTQQILQSIVIAVVEIIEMLTIENDEFVWIGVQIVANLTQRPFDFLAEETVNEVEIVTF